MLHDRTLFITWKWRVSKVKKKKLEKRYKELKKEHKLLAKDAEELFNECVALKLDLSYYMERLAAYSSAAASGRVEEGSLAIKDVVWNGDETSVIWCDDTVTTVKRADSDTYDRATAIAFCIAKKVLVGNLRDTVEYYSEGEKVKRANIAAAEKAYKCLGSKNKEKKKCAEAKWRKVPHSIKQAVRARRRSS